LGPDIQPPFKPGAGWHMKIVRKFLRNAAVGATDGLIAAGVALSIIVAVDGFGVRLNSKYPSMNSFLKSALQHVIAF